MLFQNVSKEKSKGVVILFFVLLSSCSNRKNLISKSNNFTDTISLLTFSIRLIDSPYHGDIYKNVELKFKNKYNFPVKMSDPRCVMFNGKIIITETTLGQEKEIPFSFPGTPNPFCAQKKILLGSGDTLELKLWDSLNDMFPTSNFLKGQYTVYMTYNGPVYDTTNKLLNRGLIKSNYAYINSNIH